MTNYECCHITSTKVRLIQIVVVRILTTTIIITIIITLILNKLINKWPVTRHVTVQFLDHTLLEVIWNRVEDLPLIGHVHEVLAHQVGHQLLIMKLH